MSSSNSNENSDSETIPGSKKIEQVIPVGDFVKFELEEGFDGIITNAEFIDVKKGEKQQIKLTSKMDYLVVPDDAPEDAEPITETEETVIFEVDSDKTELDELEIMISSEMNPRFKVEGPLKAVKLICIQFADEEEEEEAEKE